MREFDIISANLVLSFVLSKNIFCTEFSYIVKQIQYLNKSSLEPTNMNKSTYH